MLSANDNETQVSLRLLRREVRSGTKPLLLWAGAGVSRWVGFPSWIDSARLMRKHFKQYVHNFNNAAATDLIEGNRLPDFFHLCKQTDSCAYNAFISDLFTPRPITSIYQRFIDAVSSIKDLRLVTTNIDEMLEQNISGLTLFQRSDISRCADLLCSDRSFLAKLHGTRSDISSVVFTSGEYAALTQDQQFVTSLTQLLNGSTVIFLGYGLHDTYLLQLLAGCEKEKSLFGAGPHFIIGDGDAIFPRSVHRIRYSTKVRPDHSAALTVLDIVRQERIARDESRFDIRIEKVTTQEPSDESAYYISEVLPPGTWQTSQEVKAVGRDGHEITFIHGTGFTNDELIAPISTAHHDLAVGLICFDKVYLPLGSLGIVHNLIGSSLFWELVALDVLRFVRFDGDPAVTYPAGEAMGSMKLVYLSDEQGESLAALEIIRRQITPAQGYESVAGVLIDTLVGKCLTLTKEDQVALIDETQGALLMPMISRLLGIGDAITPSQVPLWLGYPYLRLASLVQIGGVCRKFRLSAARIPFGGQTLAGAAFGIFSQGDTVDQCASYVLSGRFDAELGSAIFSDPRNVKRILRFRDSDEGRGLRQAVKEALSTDPARDLFAAVNGGLKQMIPSGMLGKARAKASVLFSDVSRASFAPAVWANDVRTDGSLSLWRSKSLRLLEDEAKRRGVKKDDACLCGSGEKFRHCCLPPLRLTL